MFENCVGRWRITCGVLGGSLGPHADGLATASIASGGELRGSLRPGVWFAAVEPFGLRQGATSA